MNESTHPAYVLGGNRIPFARSNAQYAKASNQDMLTTVIDGIASSHSLQGERLGEVAAGAVLKHARDINLTREAVLGTKLAPETPAFDIGQACGTGLEAAILAANKIALGQTESAIAGGADTTSDAPISLNDDLREILLEANAARSTTARIKALAKVRPGQIVPDFPRNAEPRTGLSMGEHTAIMAREWGLTREEQDELAAASHQNLAAAYGRGFMDDLVSPYLGLERDGNLRPEATVESLAKLKPVFGGEGGTMTAGNSTPLSDGASAVLLGTEEWAAGHGIEP
ncbi:MAG: acetyl-CoA C-acyltransferase, partial [Actinomycetota bacterium]|nr:acetyl-CoA C-acyltransferase [Actinomycetota bacterium]